MVSRDGWASVRLPLVMFDQVGRVLGDGSGDRGAMEHLFWWPL